MMTGEVVRTPGKSVKRRIKEQYSVITLNRLKHDKEYFIPLLALSFPSASSMS